MKSYITLLAIITATTVYSEVPELPSSQEGKLAVQIIKLESLSSLDPMSELKNLEPDNSPSAQALLRMNPEANAVYKPSTNSLFNVEKILNDPNNKIFEYPVLYAEVGVAVTNDQTQTVMLPEDFEIIDGEAIPKEKPCKLGISISTTIVECKNNIVDLKLNLFIQKLKGFDEYTLEGGLKVKMPKLESRAIDTDVSIILGGWTILGGLKDETEEGNPKNTIYLIRVI